MCSKLRAFLSAGPGWISAPLESAGECSPESESPLAGWEIYTSLYESVTFSGSGICNGVSVGCVGECSLFEGTLQIGGGIWDSCLSLTRLL